MIGFVQAKLQASKLPKVGEAEQQITAWLSIGVTTAVPWGGQRPDDKHSEDDAYAMLPLRSEERAAMDRMLLAGARSWGLSALLLPMLYFPRPTLWLHSLDTRYDLGYTPRGWETCRWFHDS